MTVLSRVETVGFERPMLQDRGLCAISLIKFPIALLLATAMFYVMNWAFLDIQFVGAQRLVWGGLVLAGGVAGLSALVLFPFFIFGAQIGAVLFAGAAVAYATHRNTLVTPPLRVLTAAHGQRIRQRWSGQKTAVDESGPVSAAGRDILFIKTNDVPIRLEAGSAEQRLATREVERVLYDAIVRRASAVGYLDRLGRGEVRYRVGGEMVSAEDVQPPASDLFVATIKRMADLDPAETRKPQEGRCRALVGSQTFELRIKTAGTVKGEQVVVRILDAARAQMRLEDLGLTEVQAAALKEALGARPGLVILSAPKDSGLTATLGACLRHYDRYLNNVILLEPHTDLEIENVQHVVINQEDGPVAVAEVQSRLRDEPAIVAVDSLYLPELAQALAHGLKEKCLLAGLRAADANQAMGRAAAMFGSAQPLAERLQAVVNQRLVRLLCPDCKEPYRPNPEFLRKANLLNQQVDMLYRPPTRRPEKGKPAVCPRCRNERYAGRRGLFEVMPIDAAAREMIARGRLSDVRTYVRKLGARNLQEEGLQMVTEGWTSIDEVMRAIKQTA
jgi:type II secretory ATPase GspE/PulE/Tfp pilus assembly ATPase PilB-like protein